ncbi:MAG TPA: hypothetical protein VIF62_33865 [Labilithrix sp.]|jgi:hypothetical protein
MKRALPLAERFRIRQPCPVKWEDLVGDAKTRFCAVCNKNVHDLGGMTREEAIELAASGRACVRVKMSAAIGPAAVAAAATVVFALSAACSGAVPDDPNAPAPIEPTVQTSADSDAGPEPIHMAGEMILEPAGPMPGK